MNFVLIVNCVTSESGAPRFTPSLITPVGVMKVAMKDDLNQYFANQADNPTIKFAFCSRNMSYSTGSKFHILIDVGEIEKKLMAIIVNSSSKFIIVFGCSALAFIL